MSETETKLSESEPGDKDHRFNLDEFAHTLSNIMCAIRGIDPKQVQGMAKFVDMDNVDETTYYPNQLTSVAIAQLRMFGAGFYKGESWNPYDLVADLLGQGFKGFKGFKTEQYKDITSGQPNLSSLTGLPQETQQGLLSGLLKRGKTE